MTVRPGKKFGFQSAAENLQRWRRPDWLRQTVPDRCSSRWKGGRMHSAWNDQRWCSRRAQSSTCVEVWHALKIWGQVAKCKAVEAAIHQHCQPERSGEIEACIHRTKSSKMNWTELKLLVGQHSKKWTKMKLKGTREVEYLRQVKWCKHKERGGRRKSHFAAEEGGKCNSRHCCLRCKCNDVIAIISHRVHRHTQWRTEWPIS